MAEKYIYASRKTWIFTEIFFIIIGIIFYIAIGMVGTIGIAILLWWIVHNYKYEKCENVYELYDIANREHVAYIKTNRNLRKGEIICCSTIGDWYIDEVNVILKPLYAEDNQTNILTHDEEQTICLLKCRKIYDLVPEKLLKKEQIEEIHLSNENSH